MGKCTLNQTQGVKYLSDNIFALTGDNITDTLARGSATFIEGKDYLAKYSKTKEGAAEVDRFIVNTIKDVLANPDNITFITPVLREDLNAIIKTKKSRSEFVKKWTRSITEQANNLATKAHITPDDSKVNSYSTELEYYNRELNETNGADSDEGQVWIDTELSDYLRDTRGTVATTSVFDIKGFNVPLDTTIQTTAEFLADNFNGFAMKSMYRTEFLPLVSGIIVDEYLSHLAIIGKDGPNAEQIMENVIKILSDTANSVDISNDFLNIKSGRGTAEQRNAYYAVIALENMNTVLHHSVKIIVADVGGKTFKINDASDKYRKSFSNNLGSIDGVQASNFLIGFITNTPRLVFSGTPGVYEVDPDFPMLVKEDLNIVAQYLATHKIELAKTSPAAVMSTIMKSFLKPPTQNASDEEHILHSIAMRFYGENNYYIKDFTGKLYEHKPLAVYSEDNTHARKAINKIKFGLASQLSSLGINSQATSVNGRSKIRTGRKALKQWYSEASMASNLFSISNKTNYTISARTLKVLKSPDGDKNKFLITLKTGKASYDFAFNGKFNPKGRPPGIKPNQVTSDNISNLLATGSGKIILLEMMKSLRFPSEMIDTVFLSKFESMTSGNNVQPDSKFDYFLANAVFMLAMNIPSNKASLNSISSDILPKSSEGSSFVIDQGDYPANPEFQDGLTLEYSPFTVLKQAAIIVDNVLTKIRGKNSPMIFRGLNSGSQYGMTALSPMQEIAATVQRAKLFGTPAGITIPGYDIDTEMSVIIRAEVKKGDIIKSVAFMNGEEHLESIVNSVFLKTLIDSNGLKAAFPVGAATDSGRPHNVVMKSTTGNRSSFISSAITEEVAFKLRNEAVKYHTDYYSALNKGTRNRWAEYLLQYHSYSKSKIIQVTRSLTALDKFIKEEKFTLTEVKRYMTAQIDFVSYGNEFIAIKPEYIYLSEKVFAKDTRTAALNYLESQYTSFKQSFKNVTIHTEHRESLASLFGKESISKTNAKNIVQEYYFWNAIMFRDIARRASVGDVITFKGSMDRSFDDAYLDKLDKVDLEDTTIVEQAEELEQMLIDQSLANMMIDQGKRTGTSFTGSMRVQKKTTDSKGSMLQHYNPNTGEGGVHAIMFDEISLRNMDILGSKYDESLDDVYDGIQWGHPLFFLQFNEGILDSYRNENGSAFKSTLFENNGYTGGLHKNSIQNLFSYENLKRSKKVRQMLKMANTKISFKTDMNGNSVPVRLTLPKVIMSSGRIQIDTNAPAIEVEVTNMHDLYTYFGETLGDNVYEGMSSFEFIHDYILSGEKLPNGEETGFLNEWSNKYAAIIGTTSSKKMGNKGVNSQDLFHDTDRVDDVVTTLFDPYNYGIILNAKEEIESSEGKETSRVKMFTQVLRSISLGGHNLKEANVVQQAKALISNISNRQVVDDQIESRIMEILVHEATLDIKDTKLSPEIHRKAVLVRKSIEKNPDGMQLRDYNALKALIKEGGEELDVLGTAVFMGVIAREALKHIDHDQDVLQGFKEENLSFNSKQVSGAFTKAFLSIINKATVKKAFKGSHGVLGPSHGLIPVYEVRSETNNISSIMTWDEYTKAESTSYRQVLAEQFETYKEYFTLETKYRYTSPQGTIEKYTIGEVAYARFEESLKVDPGSKLQDHVNDIYAAIEADIDAYSFKVPDIASERDLKYAGYVNKSTGKSIYDIVDNDGNDTSYGVLLGMKNERSKVIKAFKDGTLYTSEYAIKKLELDNLATTNNTAVYNYKLSRLVIKTFTGDTVAQAKAQLQEYIDARHGRLQEDSLFNLNGNVYVVTQGNIRTYKQRYKVDYTAHTKYSEIEFNIYKTHVKTGMTYDMYMKATTEDMDINDAIYDTLVAEQQQEVQMQLYDVTYKAVFEDGTSEQIIDVYETGEEFNAYVDSEQLIPGLYEVQGTLYKIIRGYPAERVELEYTLESEPAWRFTPTEIIMTPNFRDLYFIDKYTTIMDFLGKIDYNKVSRDQVLDFYQKSIETGDWSHYEEGAKAEFTALFDIFVSKLKGTLIKNKGVFSTNLIKKVKATVKATIKAIADNNIDTIVITTDIIADIEQEIKIVNNLINHGSKFTEILYRKLDILETSLNDMQSLEKVEVNGEVSINSVELASAIRNTLNYLRIELPNLKEDYIVEEARNRARSFNAAHEVVSTRVPSQDKQSYFSGRIVAYSHQASNTMLTPAATILISGADYDIDKLFNLVYDINGNGKLQFITDLSNSVEGELIQENGQIDLTILNTYIESKIEDKVDFILSKGDMDITKLNMRLTAYKARLYEDIQSMAHNQLVKNLITITRDAKNFKQATTLINVNSLNDILKKYKSDPLSINPHDLVSDLSLDVEGLSGSYMIGIVANALKVYSLVYNARHNSDLSNKEFAPRDYMSTYHSDIAGKMRTALKSANPELYDGLVTNNPENAFTLILPSKEGDGYIVHKSENVADSTLATQEFKTNYKKIYDFKRRVRRRGLTPTQEVIEISKMTGFDSIDFSIGALQSKTQTWELFSELLSAATDNAKLLLLKKLELDASSIGITHTLLTMGFNIDTIFQFLKQKKIQKVIQAVNNGSSVLMSSKSNRTTLRTQVLFAAKGYDKITKNITSITQAFSKATEDVKKNSGKTLFERRYDKASTEEDMEHVGDEVIKELVNPLTQLMTILDVQSTLNIINTGAKITQGISSSESSIYLELARFEYQIKKSLAGFSQEEEINKKTSKTIDAIEFNLEQFLNDVNYRNEKISLVGNTSRPGFNYLAVIAGNIDIMEEKRIHVEARKRLRQVQGTGRAGEQVAAYLKSSGLLNSYESEESVLNYSSKVDELIVADYFNSSAEFSSVTLPGLDGVSFDLGTEQGRYDFLINLPSFMEYLQSRSTRDSKVDPNYSSNPFISSISLQPSSYSVNDEHAPMFFESQDVRDFPADRIAIIREAFNLLDPADQHVFELYSLLVNKSSKSIKTFESFLDFSSLKGFTTHKDSVLQTKGKFQGLLEQVSPIQLLLSSRTLIRQEFTSNSKVTSRKSFANFKKKAVPENNAYGVDLMQSKESGIVYASIARYNKLLKKGWFAVEKYMGSSSIPYDTITGATKTDLNVLLASGVRPFKITYKIPGSDDTAEGYILGAMKGSIGYVILNKDFEIELEASRANTALILRQLNDHLDISGNYIGKKPLKERSGRVTKKDLTDNEINKESVDNIYTFLSTYYKNRILTQQLTKGVLPEGIMGDIPTGRVLATFKYKGATITVKYLKEQRITEGKGFSSADVEMYNSKDLYHTIGYEVTSDPSIGNMFTADELGFEAIDKTLMNKALGKRNVSVINGYTYFAALNASEHDVVGTGTNVYTKLTRDRKEHWFTQSYEGRVQTRQDILDLLKAKGYTIPSTDTEVDAMMMKVFNLDTNFNTPLMKILKGESVIVHLYSMIPSNKNYVSLNRAVTKLQGSVDLIIPIDYNLSIANSLSIGMANVIGEAKNTNVDNYNLSKKLLSTKYSEDEENALVAEMFIDFKSIYKNNSVYAKYTKPLFKKVINSLATDVENHSAIILKIPDLTQGLPSLVKESGKYDLDAINNVSSENLEQAVLLMYYKKAIRNYSPATPFYVYDESDAIFKQYNFETGTFIEVSSGVPNAGDTPLVVGFSLAGQNNPDVTLVASIIQSRAFNNTDSFNMSSEVSDHKDQHLINQYSTPTQEMTEVAMSNEGVDSVNPLEQIKGIPGIYTYLPDPKNGATPPEGVRYIVPQDNRSFGEVDGELISMAEHFNSFSESGASKFKVITYAADGVLLIEETRPNQYGFGEDVVTYVVFPNETIRKEKYGNFTGHAQVKNLKGSMTGPDGDDVGVLIEKAFITTQDFIERRDQNVEGRLKLHALRQDARDTYIKSISPIYSAMIAMDPNFKSYIQEIGGLRTLFNMLNSGFIDNRLETEFSSLTNPKGSSLLDDFKNAYVQFKEANTRIYQEEKLLKEEVIESTSEIIVNTSEKNPYEMGNINPIKEAVIIFTDSEMTTEPASMAVSSLLTEPHKLKRYNSKSYTSEGQFMGAMFMNVFNSSKGRLQFVKDAKGVYSKGRFSEKAVGRIKSMFKGLHGKGSKMEKVYIEFPSMQMPISSNTDITYTDLADLLITAIEDIGRIPDNIVFSANLASYIKLNSGLMDLASIKMNRKVYSTRQPNVKGAADWSGYVASKTYMPSGKTVLEVANLRKGLNSDTIDPYLSGKRNSLVGDMDAKIVLKEVYKDWLRANPKAFYQLIKNTVNEGKVVSIGNYQDTVEQLIDAMNELALDFNIITQRTIDLSIAQVSSTGVNYKIVSRNKLEGAGISLIPGTKIKTIIDDATYIVELINDRDSFSSYEPGTRFKALHTASFEALETDPEIGENLLARNDNDFLVKVYKDPSTVIATGKLTDIVNKQFGTEVEKALEDIPYIDIDIKTKEVLNEGDFPIIFDMLSGFGGNGSDSYGGHPLYNAIADVTGTAIYTDGIQPGETTVSLVGTLLGDQFYNNTGKRKVYLKTYNSNQIKSYFDGTVVKILDNYIIQNKLSVAIAGRPGIENEIVTYLLGTGKYSWANDNKLVYVDSSKPVDIQDTSEGETMSVVIDNTPGVNMNNGGSRLKRNVFIPNAHIMVGNSNGSDWITKKNINSWSKKGRSFNFKYLPGNSVLDTVGMFDKLDIANSFITDYESNINENSPEFDVNRNTNFIKSIVAGIVNGKVDSKVSKDILDRIIDSEGNLILYDPVNGAYSQAHPMLKYAVARSKRAALMLIQNNFQSEFKIGPIEEFINDQIAKDLSDSEFWSKYANNKYASITRDEFNIISSELAAPTVFELMLYDITSSKDRYIDPYGNPEETAFYGKLQSLGINRLSNIMRDSITDEGSKYYHIVNPTRLREFDAVHSAKPDSNRNVYFTKLSSIEFKVKSYSNNMYNYIKYGIDSRVSFEEDSIQIVLPIGYKKLGEGVSYTKGSDIRRQLGILLIHDLYAELGFSGTVSNPLLDHEAILELLGQNNISRYLNGHINNSRSGTSLIKSLFYSSAGVSEVSNTSLGLITIASSIGKKGMLLPDPNIIDGSRLYFTEDGALYRVSRDLETFTLLKGRGISLKDSTKLKGDARPTKEGDVFDSINVEGEVLQQQVKLIRGYKTGKLIAESVETSAFFMFNKDEGNWESIDIGRNNSEYIFIAMQTPEDMGAHTNQIVADGKLYLISNTEVAGDTVKSGDGWEFKYDRDLKVFNVVPRNNKLPVGRSVRFQKEDVRYTADTGNVLEKKHVNYKVMSRIVNKLSKLTGVKAEMHTTEEIKTLFGEGYVDALGFTFEDKVIINSDKATADTPMHEFGHFYFRHLKMTDVETFNKLKDMALDNPLALEIASRYPELEKDSDEMAEEILTTMLGEENGQNSINSVEGGIITRILKTMRGWFNSIFGVKQKEYDLDFDSSLSDIMQSIGNQLLYGPRSVLNDLKSLDKSALKTMMQKELTEKQAINILKSRGFITETCA